MSSNRDLTDLLSYAYKKGNALAGSDKKSQKTPLAMDHRVFGKDYFSWSMGALILLAFFIQILCIAVL